MMARCIRGIFFDLGDTLVDFGRVDATGLFEAGARLVYAYLEGRGERLPAFAKFHRRQLWVVRWKYFKSRVTRREFNSLGVIRRLHGRMGHRLTHEQMLELAWLWYKPLRDCAVAEDGLRDLLRDLVGQGLKLGVVSNTFIPGEVLDRHLAEENLLKFLPTRVYSCDVRYRKPSRRIFRIALEQADLQAGETLFVGDTLRADIRGANRAGMISVLKDPDGREQHSHIHPRHRITELAELRNVVEHYNGG